MKMMKKMVWILIGKEDEDDMDDEDNDELDFNPVNY